METKQYNVFAVAKTLESAGFTRDQAEAVATELRLIYDTFATKDELANTTNLVADAAANGIALTGVMSDLTETVREMNKQINSA